MADIPPIVMVCKTCGQPPPTRRCGAVWPVRPDLGGCTLPAGHTSEHLVMAEEIWFD